MGLCLTKSFALITLSDLAALNWL